MIAGRDGQWTVVCADYVATFTLVMDSRGTFENLAVLQLVKKFPDFYETEGLFPSSQAPPIWHSSLSTALKYWELIKRVKKDQRKRQNTETVPTQSLSTTGGFPRNHSCRHPPTRPVIPHQSRFLLLQQSVIQQQTLAQCPTRTCLATATTRLALADATFPYLTSTACFQHHPNKTVVIYWQNGTKCLLSNFTFVWPCIVTNFFVIKPTICTNFTNLFWHETLHVSDSSSVHHQELIHCTLSNGPSWSCSKAVCMTYTIAVCTVNKLLMMDRRTVRNM
jgi:hypothetical protein